jgi:hypothetical protein
MTVANTQDPSPWRWFPVPVPFHGTARAISVPRGDLSAQAHTHLRKQIPTCASPLFRIRFLWECMAMPECAATARTASDVWGVRVLEARPTSSPSSLCTNSLDGQTPAWKRLETRIDSRSMCTRSSFVCRCLQGQKVPCFTDRHPALGWWIALHNESVS